MDTCLEKLTENCIREYLQNQLKTYWEDSYFCSECVIEIKEQSPDCYVNYFVSECSKLLQPVSYHMCESTESVCHGSLKKYEMDFQKYELSVLEQGIYTNNPSVNPVVYEKYQTKSFLIRNDNLEISLFIDFPFNYEVANGVRKIKDRFVTIEVRIYGKKILNIYHFPRTQINRVLYMIKQFIVFDLDPLIKEIEGLKIKYEIEKKLCSMNKLVLAQFINQFAGQNNLNYKIEEEDFYGYLQIQLPKDVFLTFKIDYRNFLEQKGEYYVSKCKYR